MRIHLKRNEIPLACPFNLYLSLSLPQDHHADVATTTITKLRINRDQYHRFNFRSDLYLLMYAIIAIIPMMMR